MSGIVGLGALSLAAYQIRLASAERTRTYRDRLYAAQLEGYLEVMEKLTPVFNATVERLREHANELDWPTRRVVFDQTREGILNFSSTLLRWMPLMPSELSVAVSLFGDAYTAIVLPPDGQEHDDATLDARAAITQLSDSYERILNAASVSFGTEALSAETMRLMKRTHQIV